MSQEFKYGAKFRVGMTLWGGQDYGTITRNKIERVGLDWDDLVDKLIKNNWGFQKSTTSIQVFPSAMGDCCVASLPEINASLARVFGDNFEKVRLILDRAFNVCSCCWEISDTTYQYYTMNLCPKCFKIRETRDSLISLEQLRYEFYRYKESNESLTNRNYKPYGKIPKNILIRLRRRR
jgi:hypothetical protein